MSLPPIIEPFTPARRAYLARQRMAAGELHGLLAKLSDTEAEIAQLAQQLNLARAARDRLALGIETTRAELAEPVVEAGTRGEYDPEPT